jgi:bifunctional DNA-binding transcriptional regulator/antitoxin component of YhaV-PrlF toxin-antitoxin module
MRITKRGQVTIPLDIGERLELLPDTDVQFENLAVYSPPVPPTIIRRRSSPSPP